MPANHTTKGVTVTSPVAELTAAPDPEAAAFLADARASLTRTAPPAPPPALLLTDLTGMPDAPEPARVDVMEYRISAYHQYEQTQARRAAARFARQATVCEATGYGIRQWHSCREAAVLSLLAAAEQSAPAGDRPWHAARLNLYATAHGLRGWYRATINGRHTVQVNRIRRRGEGDRGRYYVSPGSLSDWPLAHAVIDRDSGQVAYRSHSDRIARQWIDEAEARTQSANPA